MTAPDPTTLLLFAAAASVLVVLPGPNHVYIVTRSIDRGRGAGIASSFGVETGTLVHIGFAAAGLSTIIASSAVAFDAVRYLGAAYLVYLGITALLSRKRLDLDAPGDDRGLGRIYLDGVLVNVLNPKVALFFLSFVPQFVDPARGSVASQIVVLGLVLVLIGLPSNLVYAFAAGALGGWLRRRPRFLRRQNKVVGGIYLTLGAAAALTGDRR